MFIIPLQYIPKRENTRYKVVEIFLSFLFMHVEDINKMKAIENLLTLGHVAFTEPLLHVLKSNTKNIDSRKCKPKD